MWYKQSMKTISLVLLTVLLLLSGSGYSFADNFNFVTLAYPPLEYENKEGKAKGVAVEIVETIMAGLGHEVTISVLPWTRAVKMVRTGKADAIFTAYKNPTREEFLDYCKEVLIPQAIFFYAKKGSQFQFDGKWTSLKDKRIGVVSTISYGQLFEKQKHLFQIDRVHKREYNFEKLMKGRIDLAPESLYVADYTLEQMGLTDEIIRIPGKVESVASYTAFSKKRNLTQLRDDFDTQLKKMKESGEYFEIVKKYGLELYE